MTGDSASTFIMAKPRKSLMSASPTRPGQIVSKRERRFADKVKEKSPDFSNTEGNHYWKIRRCLGLSGIVKEISALWRCAASALGRSHPKMQEVENKSTS